jgi:hypothetical protein
VVAAVITVAPQFAADRGLVAAQPNGNAGNGELQFRQRLNLVSFYLGKLRVARHRAPLSCKLEEP